MIVVGPGSAGARISRGDERVVEIVVRHLQAVFDKVRPGRHRIGSGKGGPTTRWPHSDSNAVGEALSVISQTLFIVDGRLSGKDYRAFDFEEGHGTGGGVKELPIHTSNNIRYGGGVLADCAGGAIGQEWQLEGRRGIIQVHIHDVNFLQGIIEGIVMIMAINHPLANLVGRDAINREAMSWNGNECEQRGQKSKKTDGAARNGFHGQPRD